MCHSWLLDKKSEPQCSLKRRGGSIAHVKVQVFRRDVDVERTGREPTAQTQTAQRNVTQGCGSTSREALKHQAWECKPSTVAGMSTGVRQQNESIVQGVQKSVRDG
jgi:hypothetical protein